VILGGLNMYFLLILTLLIVVSTITAGIVIRSREAGISKKKGRSLIKYNLSAFIL
jgi:hypothetical protein